LNILQPNFVWKPTKEDGLLPITNFAAAGEQKAGKVTKNKVVATSSSNMGRITKFKAQDTQNKSEATIPYLTKNTYILLKGRGCYASVVKGKSPTVYILNIPTS